MLVLGRGSVYYFGPNVKQDVWRIAPGTLFAVMAFIVVSYLFSLYLRCAPSYYAVYGSLGAVIILMLWLYLMAFIMYLGERSMPKFRSLLESRSIAKNDLRVLPKALMR